MSYKIENIRNFAIIAHIDHGKSTLADKLIQRCNAVPDRELEDRILDSMDLEKEKGITIKSQTARLLYKAKNGQEYVLNLMDTPGHVDFAYEVSRCLAACEGSLLLVDASQGVEAQTLANVYKAIESNHEIIIALNKVDLPAASPQEVKNAIEEIIGIPADDAIEISAKLGTGIDEVLESIVHNLPAPKGDVDTKLRAILIDSWYDTYLGIIVLVRIVDGSLKCNDSIKMISTGSVYNVDAIGVFTPKKHKIDVLRAGEVGFIIANIKQISDCKIGDTIVYANDQITQAFPGFKKIQAVVYCGLYTSDASDYPILKVSLEKLHLNDSSFTYEAETSSALGFGFRCGFLGLLHLEIIKERLEREFDLDLVATSPSVIYKVMTSTGVEFDIQNPIDLPDPSQIESIKEPWVRASIVVNEDYVGAIIDLCQEKRGEQVNITYSNKRMNLIYYMPLNEIIYDFYDSLKSYSRGYASIDWEFHEYREGDLIKLSILINNEPVDALSAIVHRSRAEERGRAYCGRLKELIPRQMFAIPIQAAIFGKIIARETISAFRKDVTAKCYGGDVSRKRKLLEKQKKGKKRMRMFGNVAVPNSVYIEVLKKSDR